MAESVTSTSGGSATTSGTEGTSGSPTQEAHKINSKSSFRTMEELRQKSPKLYQVMMEGVAMQIVNSMKRQQDHLKQIMRDGRRAAGSR